MMDMITPYRNLFWFGVVFFFLEGQNGEKGRRCVALSFILFIICFYLHSVGGIQGVLTRVT